MHHWAVKMLLVVCASGISLGQSASAQTEPYPSRPISLVVPAGPGTGADVQARLAAQKLGEVLGQRIVVENAVGASGIIAVQRVMRARSDGYTLLFSFNQVVTMNPNVIANLPYDVEKDLEPISRFSESPFIWMVNNEVPAKTFPELMAYAKANPGKIAVGVTGFGAAAHLGMQLLSHHTGAEFLAVNYTGNIAPDLMSNVVQMTLTPAAVASTLINSGKVKALAQTGPRRASRFADIPTVAEFIPGYVIEAWYGVWAPKGTPKPVLAQLNAAWVKVAGMPDLGERLGGLGVTLIGSTAEELAEHTRRETQMWQGVVKARNIKLIQ